MLYILLTYLFYPVLWTLARLRKKGVPQRILVIQRAQIGDLIYSTCVFREIKKKLPYSHITAMVNPITKGILENNPYVDEIIFLRQKDYKGIKGKIGFTFLLIRGGYDAVVALNPRIQYAAAPLWASIPMRISLIPDFSNLSPVSNTFRKGPSRILPFLPKYYGVTYWLASGLHTYAVRHKAHNLLALTYLDMLKPLGVEAVDVSKDVYESEDAEYEVSGFLSTRNKSGGALIGIGVSSGKKMKELGVSKITTVIDGLVARFNASVVLIGSAADSEKAKEIIGLCKSGDNIIDSSGCFSLAQLPALLKKLDLYIGVDSGITYMADALSIPIVNIAGPAELEDQRQIGKDVLIIRKTPPCAPCVHPFRAPSACATGTRECITSVTGDEIVDAAGLLLKGKFCRP
jgi:ADP-heptose:LPS heptosyltransferase